MGGGAFVGVRLVGDRDGAGQVDARGFADVEAEVPWSASTRSQVASISKQYAAAVALSLVDRGVVALDDRVTRLLPAPPQWSGVTLQQLLTHTSGMPHWGEQPGFDPATRLAPAGRLTALLAAGPADPPGSRWHYSSPGFIVLAAALEQAASSPYRELVEELVLAPLGLEQTTVGDAPAASDARGYRGGQPVPSWQLHTMPGTGDIVSSAADVLRFVVALHTGELLPPAMQRLLHDVSVPMPSSAAGRIRTQRYGLGHFLGTVDGRPARLHPGDNPGYQSLAAWLPDAATAVVVLTNDELVDVETAVADAVAR